MAHDMFSAVSHARSWPVMPMCAIDEEPFPDTAKVFDPAAVTELEMCLWMTAFVERVVVIDPAMYLEH